MNHEAKIGVGEGFPRSYQCSKVLNQPLKVIPAGYFYQNGGLYHPDTGRFDAFFDTPIPSFRGQRLLIGTQTPNGVVSALAAGPVEDLAWVVLGANDSWGRFRMHIKPDETGDGYTIRFSVRTLREHSEPLGTPIRIQEGERIVIGRGEEAETFINDGEVALQKYPDYITSSGKHMEGMAYTVQGGERREKSEYPATEVPDRFKKIVLPDRVVTQVNTLDGAPVTVSRRHAAIAILDGHLFVEDLASTNHTYIYTKGSR